MSDNETAPEVELLEMVEKRRSKVFDEQRVEASESQHRAGKLTARERMALLLDPGSFDEVGTLVEPRRDTPPTRDLEAPADGVITGFGLIDGRPVGAVATDYTVTGGSFGTIGGLKVQRTAEACLKHGFPMVQLHDGGGHRIQEALESRHSASGTGNWMTFATQAQMSGWVPQASAILGPGFAGPSNYSAMSDFVVMVRGASTMGAAGPALVRMATGEDISNEALGGALIQADEMGVADLAAESEEAAIGALRGFLSYFPSNARTRPPLVEAIDPIERSLPSLRTIVPANLRRAYDTRPIITAVLDESSFFEIKPTFATNVITGLGRLAGRPIGVIANQPMRFAGALTSPACEKIAHFVSLCDAFGIPLVSFIDTPGLLVGSMAERQALVLRSGRVVYELGQATVPRISVVLRKGYGLGYVLMGGGREMGSDLCFIWPTAHICGMQVEGAVDIAYRKQIANAPNPEGTRQEFLSMYQAQVGVLQAAESFAVDEVIDPADTRKLLVRAFARFADRTHVPSVPKKHGISPV